MKGVTHAVALFFGGGHMHNDKIEFRLWEQRLSGLFRCPRWLPCAGPPLFPTRTPTRRPPLTAKECRHAAVWCSMDLLGLASLRSAAGPATLLMVVTVVDMHPPALAPCKLGYPLFHQKWSVSLLQPPAKARSLASVSSGYCETTDMSQLSWRAKSFDFLACQQAVGTNSCLLPLFIQPTVNQMDLVDRFF